MSKLWALLVKNALVKRRAIGPTLLEILFPVYFAAILAALAVALSTVTGTYPAAPASALFNRSFAFNASTSVAAVPSPLISAFLSSRRLNATLFATVAQLTAAMTPVLVNSSYVAPFVTGLYQDTDAAATLHIVGPPLSSAPSVALALVVGLSGRFFPSINLARAASETKLVSNAHILWPAYFGFMLYFGFVALLVLLVNERVATLRLQLQLFGVSSPLYLLSHFIAQFVLQAIGLAILLIVLFAANAVRFQSVASILCLFLPFSLAFLAAAPVFEPLFASGRTATAFSFLYLLLGEGTVFLCIYAIDIAAVRYVMCVVSPVVPFGLGLYELGLAEDNGVTADIPWTYALFLAAHLIVYLFISFRSLFAGISSCGKRREGYELLEEQRGLELRIVSMRYNKEQRPALDDVSLRLEAGRCTVLLGPNGSGKSTAVKLLTGQMEPSEGHVLWNGARGELEQMRKAVGVVHQANTLWDTLTVREHLVLCLRLRGESESRVLECAASVGLDGHLDARSSSLSGGQKRKLCIAMALASPRVDVVVLDEPSSSLDPAAALEVLTILKQQMTERPELTLLLTTHEMSEASALASKVVILKDGRVRCEGSVEQLAEEQFHLGYTLVLPQLGAAQHSRESLAEIVGTEAVEKSKLSRNNEMVLELGTNVARFAEMCDRLDAAEVSYRLVSSTLTEVFLKVCDE